MVGARAQVGDRVRGIAHRDFTEHAGPPIAMCAKPRTGQLVVLGLGADRERGWPRLVVRHEAAGALPALMPILI